MEPNTTTCPSAAAETSPAIVEQDLSSGHAETTHLSPPPFLPQQPSPELMSEWASGSVLPAMEQDHATSQQQETTFPELGEVPMTGGEGDLFTQQEATFPSDGAALSGFAAGQSSLMEPNAASPWQSEMPSGSGLAPLPPSIGGGGGGSGTGMPSSEYELAPLPESLLMPSMEEASLYNMSTSTMDGSLMPWDCGSSSMGGGGSSMTSLEDLTFGAMGAATLQMQTPLFQGVESLMPSPDMAIDAMGSPMAMMQMTPSFNQQSVGGFMNSQQDLTIGAMPMRSPIMPMTHTLPQGVGSSMSSPHTAMTIGAMEAPMLQTPPSLPQDIGSSNMFSQQDLTIGSMGAPVLPMMTPSLPVPQGVGSSMSSQHMTIEAVMEAPMLPMTSPLSQVGPSNFVQPTSDAELTPAPASLQAPLLRVKEEPLDVTATHREPVFISLDEEEDELDQDAIPRHVPDNSTGSVPSLKTKLKMLEELYNIRSMSSGAHKSSYMPPIPRSSSTWRAGSSSTLASSRWAGGSSSSTLSSSTRAGANNRSTLLASTRPGVSSTLLSSTRPGVSSTLLSSARDGASSSSHAHINVNGVLFTDAEMEVLRTDKNMQELVITDTKRVKRTIANRICAARKHALKEMHTLELERQVEALHTKWKEMSIQLQVQEVQCAELWAKNRQMGLMMKELERQDMLKDAMTEALEAEIEALKRMNLRSPTSDSGVDGLQK